MLSFEFETTAHDVLYPEGNSVWVLHQPGGLIGIAFYQGREHQDGVVLTTDQARRVRDDLNLFIEGNWAVGGEVELELVEE